MVALLESSPIGIPPPKKSKKSPSQLYTGTTVLQMGQQLFDMNTVWSWYSAISMKKY